MKWHLDLTIVVITQLNLAIPHNMSNICGLLLVFHLVIHHWKLQLLSCTIYWVKKRYYQHKVFPHFPFLSPLSLIWTKVWFSPIPDEVMVLYLFGIHYYYYYLVHGWKRVWNWTSERKKVKLDVKSSLLSWTCKQWLTFFHVIYLVHSWMKVMQLKAAVCWVLLLIHLLVLKRSFSLVTIVSYSSLLNLLNDFRGVLVFN